MKTHDLRALRGLRLLREQRAASQLMSQQRRCQDLEGELSLATVRLQLHFDHLASVTQQVSVALEEGLSVTCWIAARAKLDTLKHDITRLDSDVSDVNWRLQMQARERENSRLLHIARQRQYQALDLLIEERERNEQRAIEVREDADEGLAIPSVTVSEQAH